MAKHFHRASLKNIDNTGFGPNSAVEGGRLTNKDGSINLKKKGLPFWERISIYHSLLHMSMGKFFLVVLLFYTSINLVFATLYFLIGVNQLVGTDGTTAFMQFMDAFFFSSQTLTTVGYGHVAPAGMAANIVASTESLVGILSFALVTGLIYGRFARPKAFIVFSHNMLISPYKDGRALMFRVATYKNNHLTDVEALATIALHVDENGTPVTRFYGLKFEISKINSLALSWTIVHAINEDSPLFGYTSEDIKDSEFELIVSIKAFDDHFSNIVQQRTSYTSSELVYGARFTPMFHKASTGTHTILDLDKINAFERAEVPEPELSLS